MLRICDMARKEGRKERRRYPISYVTAESVGGERVL